MGSRGSQPAPTWWGAKTQPAEGAWDDSGTLIPLPFQQAQKDSLSAAHLLRCYTAEIRPDASRLGIYHPDFALNGDMTVQSEQT